MANIPTPDIMTRFFANFPYPKFGPDEMPTGEYEFIPVQSFSWEYVHADVGWDFMYRKVNSGVWLKPKVVANGKLNGVAMKAIQLPDDGQGGNSWEFLPIITLSPR